VHLWREEVKLKKNTTHGLASKFWVLRERRKFIRFDDEIKIRYNLMRKNKAPNFIHSKTTNISRKGLCILSYQRLKTKDFLELELELELSNFPKPVKLTGEVVWTKDLPTPDSQGRRLFYVGVRFDKIDPQSEGKILAHLNKLKLAQGQ